MSKATFPTRRFTSAGATKEEVAAIRDEFDNSDISLQEAMFDYYKESPIGVLRQLVKNRRAEATETPLDAPVSEDAFSDDEDTETVLDDERDPKSTEDESPNDSQ